MLLSVVDGDREGTGIVVSWDLTDVEGDTAVEAESKTVLAAG